MGNDDGLLYKDEWSSYKNLININLNKVQIGRFNIVGYAFSPTFVGGVNGEN